LRGIRLYISKFYINTSGFFREEKKTSILSQTGLNWKKKWRAERSKKVQKEIFEYLIPLGLFYYVESILGHSSPKIYLIFFNLGDLGSILWLTTRRRQGERHQRGILHSPTQFHFSIFSRESLSCFIIQYTF